MCLFLFLGGGEGLHVEIKSQIKWKCVSVSFCNVTVLHLVVTVLVETVAGVRLLADRMLTYLLIRQNVCWLECLP